MPTIEIDGSTAGDADGLRLTGGSSTVRGLSISGFARHGILIEGLGDNAVEGNVVGPNGDLHAVDAPFGDVEDDPRTVLSLDLDGARHAIAGGARLELRRENVGVGVPLVLYFGRRAIRWFELHGDVHLDPPCRIRNVGRSAARARPKACFPCRFVLIDCDDAVRSSPRARRS